MKGFTFGADPESWSSEPKPPMEHDDWHLYRGYWDQEKGSGCAMVSPYEQDFPNINISQDDDEWVVYCEDGGLGTRSSRRRRKPAIT